MVFNNALELTVGALFQEIEETQQAVSVDYILNFINFPPFFIIRKSFVYIFDLKNKRKMIIRLIIPILNLIGYQMMSKKYRKR